MMLSTAETQEVLTKPFNIMVGLGQALLNQEFSVVEQNFRLMDLFGYNPNGHSCEIEIKVNDYDFYKEFSKPSKKKKHQMYEKNKDRKFGFCPRRFYFFVPYTMEKRALKWMKQFEWYKNYGLLTYNHFSREVRVAKKSNILNRFPFRGIVPVRPYGCDKYKRINI